MTLKKTLFGKMKLKKCTVTFDVLVRYLKTFSHVHLSIPRICPYAHIHNIILIPMP